MKIFQEITPLTSSDVFIILDSVNKGFDYPIHNHPEFELTLILGASGNRIVGDSSQEYQQQDLVLIGPYLFHKWDDLGESQSTKSDCRVITIQFDMNLFKGSLFGKLPFTPIHNLLQNASRGIQFTGTTFHLAKKMITRLVKLKGFESVIEFLQLLDLLARSKSHQYLTSIGFDSELLKANTTRLHAAYHFILHHFKNPQFRISEVSSHLCLSDSAFSHFFKKCTNRSFSEFLIETRLGNVCKLLIDTDDPISEIAFCSGFNNMTNFNRTFKKKHHCSPKIFRSRYQSKNAYDWTNQMTPGQFVPITTKAKANQDNVWKVNAFEPHYPKVKKPISQGV